MTNFVSVATSAARYQDISLNPQKLAGQCAKLKCCLNYEVDAYVEGIKRLPSREIALETRDNTYYHFKTDIFNRQITYSTSKEVAANLVTISASRAFEIIALNKRGVRPDVLDNDQQPEVVKKEFGDVVGQDSLTRFDKNKKKNSFQKKKRKPIKNKPSEGGEESPRNNNSGGEKTAVHTERPQGGGNKNRGGGQHRRPPQKNENKTE